MFSRTEHAGGVEVPAGGSGMIGGRAESARQWFKPGVPKVYA